MTDEVTPPRIYKVAPETIQKLLAECSMEMTQPEGRTATHVNVYLKNGYFVASGFSGTVDPAAYNAEVGKDVALRHAIGNAESKLWELEGYALMKDREAGRYIPTLAELDLPPFVLRMLIEHNELAAKLANLQSFINSNAQFKQLTDEEQKLLVQQAQVQIQLLEILTKRYKLLQGL